MKLWVLLLSLAFCILCGSSGIAGELEGICSWYSVESCLKESGQYVMANGERLDDSKYTCAIYGWDFGTNLLVTNLFNKKTCRVVVTDRGPNKRLKRLIDLSKASFEKLAPLSEGLIKVRIEQIR